MTVRQMAHPTLAIVSDVCVNGLLIAVHSFRKKRNVISVDNGRVPLIDSHIILDARRNRMIAVDHLDIELFVAGTVSVVTASDNVPIE